MKKLSPLWFVKPPYDLEHKEYVLLDFLKDLWKNSNPENCYSTLRILSGLVKDLNKFKEYRELPKIENAKFSKDDESISKEFNYSNLTEEEKEVLDEIVENSLETLYEYSEICLGILKDEESKIKIFKVDPLKVGKKNTNSGILIVRNMISDKIIPYMWQGDVTLKTEDGNKQICILKKIPIKNPNFSLNYEHIYHEILQEAKMKNPSPELFVIEIYENFDEESEIYKLAKEKFVEGISK